MVLPLTAHRMPEAPPPRRTRRGPILGLIGAMALLALGAGPTSGASDASRPALPTIDAPAPHPLAMPAQPAPSVPPPPPPAVSAGDSTSLLVDQEDLAQLQNQIETAADDASLAAVGARTAAIQAHARTVAASRTQALAAFNRATRGVPAHGAAAVARAAQRSALQDQVRQARAVAAAASQTFTLVAERRREGFSARVLQQSASPLSPAFWAALAASVGPDLDRLNGLAREAADQAANAEEPKGVLSLGLGALVAGLLAWPVRRLLARVGQAALARRGRAGRFRRSARALWMSAVNVGAAVAAVWAFRLAADWGDLLSEEADASAGALTVAAGWAVAILALGRALVSDADPSQRLATVSDGGAPRARRLLRLAAPLTAAGYLLSRLNYVVGASVAATVASNAVVSVAYVLIAAAALLTFSRGRQEGGEDPEIAGSPLWTLVSLGLGLAIVVTLGAIATGFTTLAVLISGQLFWLAVLAATGFLLLRFVDDLCAWLFGPTGWASRILAGVFSLRRSTVAQIGVLSSAGLRLAILIGGISFALTPFGDSGRLLFSHFGQVGQAIRLGSATIAPRAIASGLLVFALGLAGLQFVRGWFVRRYLPVTGWDAGVRNSLSTGVQYLGVAVTLLCALAAMGLGFQQIALVASALSVGIGFGLQQVVQNFVSGIILLIERPVKVGDWVSVGGLEGDIRRIRVRATEIETFDRTTVIVPNSDLITKQVQNKTLGDPRGRVQLDLSIASPDHAQRARDLILKVAADLPEVLSDPKPAVYIDALIAGGGVNFKCFLFVDTPRDVFRVRSNLYFAILSAFRADAIDFSGVQGPQTVVVEPSEALARALASLGAPASRKADPPSPAAASSARKRRTTPP
jgi:potassium efflux system protein